MSRYLSSGDFNGLPVSPGHQTNVDPATAARLIRKGMIEVIDGDDYLNPHIRPWSPAKTLEQQIRSVKAAAAGDQGVACLYPTAPALVNRVDRLDYERHPYTLMLAIGGTTLQPVYFRPDVLEPYREDPRFNFRIEDFGVMFNITDEVFLSETEPENENVTLLHGGLAYNMTKPEGLPLRRAVCVLLTDLHRFPPDLQTRWSTFELPDQSEFERHPAWWSSQMGNWPEMIGPFARMFGEMETLQAMHKDITGEPIFTTTDPPQEFGWILRPSIREYNRFVHDLDKLLSENLRHKALDRLGVPAVADDGTRIGTLRRLELHLEGTRLKPETRNVAMAALRRVRKLRQKPAHVINENAADPTLIEEQIRLMGDVTEALWVLRKVWESKGSSVAAPSHLDDFNNFVPV